MRIIFVLALILNFTLSAQPKFEIIEYTGTVLSIRPGYHFALETIELKTKEDTYYFRIDPDYGQSILSKLVIGQSLTLKASVNLHAREVLKALKRQYIGIPYHEQIVEIKLGNDWIATPSPENKRFRTSGRSEVLLEKKIIKDYFLDDIRKGLIFDKGVIAFAIYAGPQPYIFSMEGLYPGSVVSFLGYKSIVSNQYIYPIEGVKEVYSFVQLNRIDGRISAFIHKQNFLRMGLVINNLRLSFPGDYAERIEKLAADKNVTVYYSGRFDEKTNSLPTIHALIHEGDTILISKNYYGDPDGKHEFQFTELDGKISKVNRSDKGKIISLIMGSDCYVEVDYKMAEQLGHYLSKGKSIKISGDERIKKEGEIYEQNYRIITPRKIVADGKEFILKN